MQVGDDRGVGGQRGQVLALLGVLGQVVELGGADVALNELEVPVADHAPATVLVVDDDARLRGVGHLPGDEPGHGAGHAQGVLGGADPGELAHGLQKGAGRGVGRHAPRLGLAGKVDEEGDAHRALPEVERPGAVALAPHAVVTGGEAVVRHVHDNRVLLRPARAQLVKDGPQGAVDAGQAGRVAAQAGQRVGPGVVEVVQGPGPGVALLPRDGGEVAVRVQVGQLPGVGVHPRGVGGGEADLQVEGAAGGGVLRPGRAAGGLAEEGAGLLGDRVGQVAPLLGPSPVPGPHRGAVVGPAPQAVGVPVAEARGGALRGAHVPLAHHGAHVPGLLQRLREGRQAAEVVVLVGVGVALPDEPVVDPVRAGHAPGQEGGPRRGAHRGGAVVVLEAGRAGHEVVQDRGDELGARTAHGPGALVIGEDYQHVGVRLRHGDHLSGGVSGRYHWSGAGEV